MNGKHWALVGMVLVWGWTAHGVSEDTKTSMMSDDLRESIEYIIGICECEDCLDYDGERNNLEDRVPEEDYAPKK